MRITMYLLDTQAKLTKETLRRHHLYDERPLRVATDGISWRLFVYPGTEKDARWLEDLRPLLAPDSENTPIKTRTAGAVLLVQAHGRIFAITFGSGFHAINSGLTERDFGLKVAANSIDPNKVTLADARGLSKGHRNATSRLPTPNEVFALGLLTDEEWIRRFGGQVKNSGFAKKVSGADSLQLDIANFSLLNLSQKLGEALELYERSDYRKTFPFLDYFRRETEKFKIQELDLKISDAIRRRDPAIGFALPDEFDLAPDSYTLSRRGRKELLSELTTEDVYDAIENLGGWDNPLEQIKVEGSDSAGQVIAPKAPLRSYAIGLVRYNSNNHTEEYALTAGAWFRVNQEYIALIDRYIKDNVPDLTQDLRLLTWDEKFLKENIEGRYGEERYNKWMGKERGYVVLDRKPYRDIPGAQVEICDLLTANKELICVKRMDGSDKMSHLFQQGSVSAQMIMDDENYRDKLMSKLRILDPNAEFGTASQWTVVYAVATGKSGELKDIMYFFAKTALKIHTQAIKGRGFKVAVVKINRIALNE